MARQARGILQIAILVGIVLALVRLFPLLVRAGEAAALSIVKFWWIVLILALGGWLAWVLNKRNDDAP